MMFCVFLKKKFNKFSNFGGPKIVHQSLQKLKKVLLCIATKIVAGIDPRYLNIFLRT